MKKTRVLVVDDSPVFRALLQQVIESDDDLEVVGTAQDPYEARELIKKLNPDVLTLDIEMPKMNGVQFLKNLMRLRPMPVVMISTLTQHGAEPTLVALELGAVDYFPKPAVDSSADLLSYKAEVVNKIKMAATANVKGVVTRSEKNVVERQHVGSQRSNQFEVIAIGASTGGTEAVRHVLSALPGNLPPIVISQHISAMFSESFAKRLDASSDITVRELQASKAPLINGVAYVASGDKHLVITKRGNHLYCQQDDGPPVNRHKPSVDVMFDSIAEAVRGKAIGVILTGMGNDGAKGMQRMHDLGAVTIAQDQNSSVVWGMPKVAYELGVVDHLVDLDKVAKVICEQFTQNQKNTV